MKQILCIKWGTFYGPQYVNILYSMVARNITGPFKLYCFTDNADGIRPEVTCHPLPELGCEIPPGTKGKWRKTALWGSELFGVTGTVLFVDLDSIIVGNIDDYFTYGSPEDVITARNWVKPQQRLGQTSVFRFKIGSHPYMLENLRADPGGISKKYQFEQHYVTHGIRGGIKFWPSEWTRHFRVHCLPVWPLRMFIAPKLPKKARIITFPGGPNPSDIIVGRWSPDDVHRSPWGHISHVWELRKIPGVKWTRELKRYVRPAPWISQHWRED
ncbi:glycosyl transferase [Opitutaceae bacterium TAV4]|nr:glycosyl transferase [Opitutaceae bacterium TAV4]RRK01153.1 glycosyl transferase [Opitutaceae bacterium TAV3]